MHSWHANSFPQGSHMVLLVLYDYDLMLILIDAVVMIMIIMAIMMMMVNRVKIETGTSAKRRS